MTTIKMSQLEFGTSGWPPISTWISPSPLGSNGLHCVECTRKRKAFSESESWWVACLVGEVVLLGMWKAITNLLLAGLNLFHQPIVSEIEGALCRHHCRWRNNIFYLFSNLLLLDRRYWGCSGCSGLLFILWTYCEEVEFNSMRDYLAALFWWCSSRN